MYSAELYTTWVRETANYGPDDFFCDAVRRFLPVNGILLPKPCDVAFVICAVALSGRKLRHLYDAVLSGMTVLAHPERSTVLDHAREYAHDFLDALEKSIRGVGAKEKNHSPPTNLVGLYTTLSSALDDFGRFHEMNSDDFLPSLAAILNKMALNGAGLESLAIHLKPLDDTYRKRECAFLDYIASAYIKHHGPLRNVNIARIRKVRLSLLLQKL